MPITRPYQKKTALIFLSQQNFAFDICEIYTFPISNYINLGVLFTILYSPRSWLCYLDIVLSCRLVTVSTDGQTCLSQLVIPVIIFKFLDKLSTASMPKADCCIRFFIGIYSISDLYRDCQSIINLVEQTCRGFKSVDAFNGNAHLAMFPSVEVGEGD